MLAFDTSLRAPIAIVLGLVLAACHDDTPQFTVAPTVSGLTAGQEVVLTDNTVDQLTVTTDGTFAFKRPIAQNGSYSVTVATQPVGEVCTVVNSTGAGVTANVTNVRVTCSTDAYSISGAVSGLPGSEQLVLANNGANALTVSANGKFTFTAPIAYDGSYLVTVITQPAEATCSVTNAMGAGVTANVSNVSVSCSLDSFSISGAVSGLASGAQVTLNDNGTDPLTLTANGSFIFPTHLSAGGSYTVAVGTQPTGATCTVSNGQGTNISGNVNNVGVTCDTDTFSIGGTLSGLAGGTQVTLDNNGADPLTLTANGPFTFDTPVTYGSVYNVTVGTQPNGQLCTVSAGSGSQVASIVSTVAVSCTANPVTFTTPGTYTWTVPPGVSALQIVATGGGGGGGGLWGVGAGQVGGAGAQVTSTLSVTAGQVLNVVVGGAGKAGASGPAAPGGGWTCGAGGGGGGASSVDAGTAWQIIAGGGGGGGSCNNATPGGSGGSTGGVGSSGGSNGEATGGSGGSGGTGGAGGVSEFFPLSAASGGNGNGGPGGSGGSNGGNAYPGGTGGSGVGTGTGGNDTSNDLSGGGGGGYGGGGTGVMSTGGGAGGSTGPANTTYGPASNGGASATNGGDGSIVITIQ